ncbi:MarR family winged helix-turn-helix transcriptional regulator [Lactobacillus sp. PV034]|uniref:MarR family winged helix-turn-helix transcriptional regulator n=1 Tax=Lactobacillus sp. PV034 TaxID=2594495 RepID=UPI002240997D|nr:MarR family transcriptional regulator [Lactobacillus sp. PV034]QNQ80943.1 MarR family transcriptional regulator [Lactobacillus sp. PV034]
MNKLYKEISDALYNSYYGIERIEQTELKKSKFKDLTPNELHAIDAIGLHNHLTTSQLAEKLHVTRATISTQVDRLVRKGYVERVRDEKDRRIIRLKLTHRGKLVCRAYHAYHNLMVKSFLENLNEDELQTIYRAFKNLEKFTNSH